MLEGLGNAVPGRAAYSNSDSWLHGARLLSLSLADQSDIRPATHLIVVLFVRGRQCLRLRHFCFAQFSVKHV